MDADRFDDLARALTGPRPRRGLFALGLGGLLAALGLGDATAKKGRGKQGKGKGKGKGNKPCKGKRDDARCKGDGKCLNGKCNPKPTCTGPRGACAPNGPNSACCSGACDLNGLGGCFAPGPGDPCRSTEDCLDPAAPRCVGYRCRA